MPAKLMLAFFLVVVFNLRNFVASSETFSLHHIINLFPLCSVKLLNYQNVELGRIQIPVSIYSKGQFQLEQDESSGNQNCLVLFYILPGEILEKTSQRRDDGERNGNHRRIKDSTSIRFDVLVDMNMKARRDWWTEYKHLYTGGKTTNGIILNISKISYFEIELENKLEIVNNLQLGKEAVVGTLPLDRTLDNEKLRALIGNVNDVSKNLDAPWYLSDDISRRRIIHGTEFCSEVKSEFVWYRIRENLILACIAIQGNVTLKENHRSIGPSIRFNVRNGKYMTEEIVLDYGFITFQIEPKVTKSLWEMVIDLLSVYQMTVYIGMGISYILVPFILLGHIYQYLLKNKMGTKYSLSWHPFCWGFRALVRQPDDRRFNSKRFGFMAWIAYPLSLISVIFSHIFAKYAYKALVFAVAFSGFRHDYVYSSNSLRRSGLSELNRESVSDPTEIQRRLVENRTLYYMDRLEYIEYLKDIIKRRRWYDNTPMFRTGTFFGQRRQINIGWKVEFLGDDNFLRRLKLIQGESQIMRKVKTRPMKVNFEQEYPNYVRKLNFWAFQYIFVVEGAALWSCLVVLMLEIIVGMMIPEKRDVVRKISYKKDIVTGLLVCADCLKALAGVRV